MRESHASRRQNCYVGYFLELEMLLSALAVAKLVRDWVIPSTICLLAVLSRMGVQDRQTNRTITTAMAMREN